MKKKLIKIGILVIAFGLGSYTTFSLTKKQNPPKNAVMIIKSKVIDGRQTFNVLFKDGKVLDNMYGEEVLNGLTNENWSYDEDMTINEVNLNYQK